MNEPLFSPCPYLGLFRDRSSIYIGATPEHRCYAHERLIAPDQQHQDYFCLGENHNTCSVFQSVASNGNQPHPYAGEKTATDEMTVEMTAVEADETHSYPMGQTPLERAKPIVAESAMTISGKTQKNHSKADTEKSTEQHIEKHKVPAASGLAGGQPHFNHVEPGYFTNGKTEGGEKMPLQNSSYQDKQTQPHQPQVNYSSSPWGTTQPPYNPLVGNGNYLPPQQSLTYAAPPGYQVPHGQMTQPNYSWQPPSQVEYQLVPVGTLQSGANWYEPEPPKRVNWVQISTLVAATILVLIASALLYSSLSDSAFGVQPNQDQSLDEATIATILSNASAIPSTMLNLVDIAPVPLNSGQAEAQGANAISASDASSAGAQASTELSVPKIAANERVAAQAAVMVNDDSTAAAPITTMSDGISISLRPTPEDVIWWKSDDTSLNHQGDTVFYAGTYAEQSYVAGIRFDLADLPPASTLLGATLHLTGMEDNRFRANSNSAWLVQLIAEEDIEGHVAAWQESTFDEISTIPASHLLFPLLNSADLAVRRTNRWTFDRPTQQWLEGQIQSGAQAIYIRILPIASGNETLFGWDSGVESQSSGAGPELILSLDEPLDVAQSASTEIVSSEDTVNEESASEAQADEDQLNEEQPSEGVALVVSPAATLVPMPRDILADAMQAATATASAQLNTLTELLNSSGGAETTSATEQILPTPTATLAP